MLNFNNTELAFRNKSNYRLKEAYQLFKVLNNKGMVKLGEQIVNIAFAVKFPINGILRQTIYKHFVGGRSINDCSRTIKALSARNVYSILDYAKEGEESEEAFNNTLKEIIKTIEFAQNNKKVPFSAFKITGIGRFKLLEKASSGGQLTYEEVEEYNRLEKRVDAVFKRGYELNIPVLIDAEQTWIQPIIDKIVLNMMSKYNQEKAIVQNTYQLYRHDGFDLLKKHHQISLEKGFKFGLKIVRGAYMELERERAIETGYPSPIHLDKMATDHDFNAAIHYLISNHETIDFMVSTHNEDSSLLLARLIDENNLPRNLKGVCFSQLYGMSDHITFNLAVEGFNVAKYIPYGEVKTMMPYLFRRAKENSSMKGQTSRELNLIQAEIKRRKNQRRNKIVSD